MDKYKFLLIGELLLSGLLKLSFLSFLTNDIVWGLYCVWGLYGITNFRPNRITYNRKNYTVFYVMLVLFLLSMLSPVFFKGQDLSSTIITYRSRYLIVLGIVLLWVGPSHTDLMRSIKTIAYIALFAAAVVYVYPSLYVTEENIEILREHQYMGSTDIITSWPGAFFAVLYFYILLQRVIEYGRKNDLFTLIIFMAYIFLMQNRSTLICALPLFVYALYRCKSKVKIPIIILGVAILSPFIIMIINSLMEETTQQLKDTDYNRWQAIYFFFYEQNSNLFTFLFGNGVPSKGSYYLQNVMNAQMYRNAYISDLGLLGSFYYYGICMMIILYSFVFKAAFNRKHAYPKFLKYYCWWILLVPTIHSFGLNSTDSIVNFCLILYMIVYYSSINYERTYGCISNNCQLQHCRNNKTVYRKYF